MDNNFVQLVPTSGKERVFWIFLFAALTEIVWGLSILFSGPQKNVPVSGLLKVFSEPWLVALALIVAGCLAIRARWSDVEPADMVVWVIPQQLVMLLTLVAAVTAVAHGQYADGVIRPRMFILTDQLPLISGTVIHSVALVDYCMGLFTHKWGVRKEALEKLGVANDG